MLKQLSYSVQFPSTGRTFDNRIVFAPGLTAIVGPNEAGKSLVVEMIRYCLFGKSALRGLAADYKNLTAELSLSAAGKEIVIVRQPKSEVLVVDGVQSAVGAEALNRSIPLLLGFGLDVFDIALAAQQDELHALTKMKPTERGKMVEKLTGETALALTEKDCKDEAKGHTTQAEAMALMLKEPVAPIQPEGYSDSEALYEAMNVIRDRNMQRSKLAQVEKPEAPVAPTDPGLDEAALDKHMRERASAIHSQTSLQRQIDAIPEPRYTLEEITATEAYEAYVDEVKRRGPRPEYELDQLVAWELYYQAGDQVTCPNCGTTFGVDDPDVAIHAVEEPSLTLAQVREQIARHSRWPTPLEEPTIGPKMNVAKEKAAHARADERDGLRHQLAQVTISDDLTADLERARDYNREWARYDERRTRYRTDLDTWEAAQTALQTLGPSESPDQAYEAWRESSQYETALKQYQRDSATFVEQLQLVTSQRTEADGFKRGADALKLTRQKVKQELTPSLSREASKLLYAMTNGERREIIVDEDFNVFVDGQPLATLSGSGKSVVNLALRIGLGRVLTSRVLPIFIGDEIDYAMDKDRVGATQDMFRGLTKMLGQVILVTHKSIEADNVVSLA